MNLKQVQQVRSARYGIKIATNVAIPAPSFTSSTLVSGIVPANKTVFYSRVHSSVVASLIKHILNLIRTPGLLNQLERFLFIDNYGEIEYDGPTMLFLILQKIDPSTVVGLDTVLKNIKNAKLGDHTNAVNKMLKPVEAK